jgi:RNA polymerase sigma factor for flagellar operon FliA
MQDYLRETDWVPRGTRSKSTKLKEVEKTLEQQHGRKPTDQELADALGITGEELHQIYAETHSINVTSLDKTWADRNDGSKDMREIDMVPDRRSEDPTENMEKIDLIRTFTKGLNKIERMIVIMYYYEDMTMREIDMVPDRRSEDPTERLAKIDLIRTFTKGLNKTERMIVIMYYYEELTMREIGAALEISESRVSQMHSAIVERMKKMYGKVA